MRLRFKVALGVPSALVAVGAAAAGFVWLELRASLPIYDGERALPGLAAPVAVERDALGVATLESENALDEARALGFVHAQERFFQMDLLRRAGAGELAALLGPAAVPLDEARRLHLLRSTAERVAREAPPDDRARLEAYAAGVNAGLHALGARPFEYWLLGQEPVDWKPEDSVLVAGAMYFTLEEDARGTARRNEWVARSILPSTLADFLYPRRTTWDAPVSGEPGSPAAVPPASVYDLRRLPRQLFEDAPETDLEALPAGSNSWAVTGAASATGKALLASDMHLRLGVPSIWFRASLVRDGRRVSGVSLPGWPGIVAGSNGSIAWAFTNSYGDWLDLIALDLDPHDPSRYRTPGGWRKLESVSSPIEVAGEATPRPYTVRRTIWGPVAGTLPDGRPYALAWVAQEQRGYRDGFAALAGATSVREALDIAERSGIPPQNFVVADARGHIGWTIMGAMPRRVRGGGLSRSGEGPAWDGWLASEDYPEIVDPPGGRIWTANARVVGGEMLAKIGDGGYDLGARATQIRDRLRGLGGATVADMLRIQLDDEALFLAHWQHRLLRLLEGTRDPLHAAVRDAVRGWGGRAATSSVGYRIVREWRRKLIERIVAAVFAEVRAADPSWRYSGYRAEQWVWPLLEQEPRHLLDPRAESWPAFELAALDALLAELGVHAPEDLAHSTWGERNTVRVQHPLSRALPILARWLDMPAVELPGDRNMPRVQGPRFGASERFALSPGEEDQAYFHMPGGQSGHPLSPYYGSGHQAWVEGRATPFLPGPAERSLRLVP